METGGRDCRRRRCVSAALAVLSFTVLLSYVGGFELGRTSLMSASRSVQGVLVTGGSSGIGRALVEQLVKQDYVVFATGRDDSALKQLGDLGVGWAAGDVANPADVERHWTAASEFFKARGAEPFGVCLNAGCAAGRMPFEQLSVEQIDTVLNTNVRGVMLWMHTVLPVLKERRQGQIVLTSSLAAIRACPGAALYSASKYAIHGLMLSLRAELKGSGVKVASVNPGAVATPWWSEPNRGGYTESKRAEIAASPMWSSMLAPEDVASQIVAILQQPPSSNIEMVAMDPAEASGVSPPEKREHDSQ